MKRLIFVGLALAAWTPFAAAQPAALPEPDAARADQPGPRLGGAAAAAGEDEPGYLGVIADDRKENGAGVRVLEVVAGGPAEKSGLKVGDLVTAIDGESIASMDAFAQRLSSVPAGGKVVFAIRRDDKEQSLEVTLGRRPPPKQRRFGRFGPIDDKAPAAGPPAPGGPAPGLPPPGGPANPAARAAPLGLRVMPVSDEARLALALPEARGALVVEVVNGSPAQKAGIPLDAVLVAVDDKRIDTPADLARLLSQGAPGQTLKLSFFHRGQMAERRVTLQAASGARAGPSFGPPGGPGPFARPSNPVGPPEEGGERIAALEQRIQELERRVQELERAAQPK